MTPTLWTIGHSNRGLAEFLQMLQAEQLEALADVRRFPGSRKHPHFGAESLTVALPEVGLEYRHFPDLGGRRSARLPDSPNDGWRVAAFRAYADYTLSPEFAAALHELLELAQRKRTVIMCAETLPWRCHRRLIADQFLARGWQVWDIMGLEQRREHELPDFARIADGRVTYPGGTLF